MFSLGSRGFALSSGPFGAFVVAGRKDAKTRKNTEKTRESAASEPPLRSKRLFEPASEPPARSKRLFEPALEPPARSKRLLGPASETPVRSNGLFEPASELPVRSKGCSSLLRRRQCVRKGCSSLLFKITIRKCCTRLHCALRRFAQLSLLRAWICTGPH